MPQPQDHPVQLTVTIDEPHLHHIQEVATNLERHGFVVEQQLEAIGIIVGTARSTTISALSAVTGVAAVEVSDHFQLAPPDSPIQ